MPRLAVQVCCAVRCLVHALPTTHSQPHYTTHTQSTKLSLYERRVMDIVNETRHLPESLALTGQVRSRGYTA